MKKKRIFVTIILMIIVVSFILKINNINILKNKSLGYFKKIPYMNYTRMGHSAVLLQDGNILITGGNSTAKNKAEIYNYLNNKFIKINKTNYPHYKHYSFLLPGGNALIVDRNSIELFNTADNSFRCLNNLPETKNYLATTFFSAVLTNNNRVLLNFDGNIQLYDLNKNKFINTTKLLTPRKGASLIKLKDGRVLIVGGESIDNKHTLIKQTEIYNPKYNKIVYASNTLVPRLKPLLTILNDGKVLIIGGDINKKTAEIYDPVKNNFSETGSLNFPRSIHFSTALLLKDGRVLLVGGAKEQNNKMLPIMEAELYVPLLRKFVVGPKMTSERLEPVSTLLNNGNVLITGGHYINLGQGLLDTATYTLKSAELFIPPRIDKNK
jgi:hypothetical protein